MVKKSKSLLVLGGIAASLLWASTAGAVSVSIGLQEITVNGGAITNETPIPVVNAIASFNGIYGNFIVNISGQGSPPNIPGNIGSSTANVIGANTDLTVWVTVQNITSPLGTPLLGLISSFTENTILPAGWTVTESTFLDTANGLFSVAGPLSSHLFNGIDTNIQAALALTGGGPYSVTMRYIIHALTPGTTLSTINLQTNPVPLPGALPLFAGGIVGLWALGRRRKKQQSAIA